MDIQTLIREIGIDQLPEDKQQELLATVFRTIEKRVSLRLAMTLTDEQAEEFARLAEGDEAALEKLERDFPEFKQIYQEELEGLLADFKAIS